MDKVFDLIAREQQRQDENVELIASENFVSERVLRAVGSCLTNKYAEGYPAVRDTGSRGRYYGGCRWVDQIEQYCCDKWREAFATDYHVNVQPHCGSNANLAAFMSVLKPGDTILSMSLSNGGHLTHGSPVNFSGKLFRIVSLVLQKLHQPCYAAARADHAEIRRHRAGEDRKDHALRRGPSEKERGSGHARKGRQLKRQALVSAVCSRTFSIFCAPTG